MELVSIQGVPEDVWNRIAAYAGRCLLCDEQKNWGRGGVPTSFYCLNCWQIFVLCMQGQEDEIAFWWVQQTHTKMRGEYARPDDLGEDWDSDGWGRESDVSEVDDA